MSIFADIHYKLKHDFGRPKNKWPLDKLVEGAMERYRTVLGGKEFDVNNPVTFPEKLFWYKLFWDNDELVRIVDKYLFKSYIKEKLGDGYTIPLIGVWETIGELERDWNNLPEEFCLKSTLQSDGQFIIFIHNRSEVDFSTVKKEVKKWFKVNNTLINSYCRAYYNATPRVIAEEYMETIAGQLLIIKCSALMAIRIVFAHHQTILTKKTTRSRITIWIGKS